MSNERCDKDHKHETTSWRECPECRRWSCLKFIRGWCRRCSSQKRYHERYRSDPAYRLRVKANGARSYLKHREKTNVRTKAWKKANWARHRELAKIWAARNRFRSKAVHIACNFRAQYPEKELPPIYGCRDCGAAFIWEGKKIDACCRKKKCRGIHVFQIHYKMRVFLAAPAPALETSGDCVIE